MQGRSKRTVAPFILPESLPPVSTSVSFSDGEAPVFAGRFAVHVCSDDQKRIFRAT